MISNPHMIRRTLIRVFLLIALAADLIIFATALSAAQAPPNPSLLAVPAFGSAPLTVDFYVGLANTPGPLIYQWNFGDGAEALVPANPYALHVYQHPGTYLCELELTTPQGISTAAFATITVKPDGSAGIQ
jgi:hypothetical protein